MGLTFEAPAQGNTLGAHNWSALAESNRTSSTSFSTSRRAGLAHLRRNPSLDKLSPRHRAFLECEAPMAPPNGGPAPILSSVDARDRCPAHPPRTYHETAQDDPTWLVRARSGDTLARPPRREIPCCRLVRRGFGSGFDQIGASAEVGAALTPSCASLTSSCVVADTPLVKGRPLATAARPRPPRRTFLRRGPAQGVVVHRKVPAPEPGSMQGPVRGQLRRRPRPRRGGPRAAASTMWTNMSALRKEWRGSEAAMWLYGGHKSLIVSFRERTGSPREIVERGFAQGSHLDGSSFDNPNGDAEP